MLEIFQFPPNVGFAPGRIQIPPNSMIQFTDVLGGILKASVFKWIIGKYLSEVLIELVNMNSIFSRENSFPNHDLEFSIALQL